MKKRVKILVLADLGIKQFAAKAGWEIVADQAGYQVGDEFEVFIPPQFIELAKAMADLELPVSRKGKYVITISESIFDLFWLEPGEEGAIEAFLICRITADEITGLESAGMRDLFFDRLEIGLAILRELMLKMIKVCLKRSSNWQLLTDEISHLLIGDLPLGEKKGGTYGRSSADGGTGIGG